MSELKPYFTNMSRDEILRAALLKFGNAAQIDMMIEEMSELTKALLKLRRVPESDTETDFYKARVVDVREEIADVQIMLDQMKIIFDGTSPWDYLKIERLAQRLEASTP